MVDTFRVLKVSAVGEVEEPQNLDNVGVALSGMALHYDGKWNMASAINMAGLSVSEGDHAPNGIQMAVTDKDGEKDTTLSIFEGDKTVIPAEGYGIHLRAKNDDPTITFKFRDGRVEECHAPATDSDFDTYLGI